MINVKYPVLEIGDLPVSTDAVIYEGTPVHLDASGFITQVITNQKVLGLSKIDKNTYRDLTYGDAGAYGSRRITIICGPTVVQLYPSWYETVDGTETKIDLWTGSFDYKTELYVNSSAQVTATTTYGNTNLGRVLEPPTVGNGGVMTVVLYGPR